MKAEAARRGISRPGKIPSYEKKRENCQEKFVVVYPSCVRPTSPSTIRSEDGAPVDGADRGDDFADRCVSVMISTSSLFQGQFSR